MTERVSDGCLASWIDRAEADYDSARWSEDFVEAMLDLRDTRAALSTERTARIAADARADDAQARLAEVETALAEAREALKPFAKIVAAWPVRGGVQAHELADAVIDHIKPAAEAYNRAARLAADTPATPTDPSPDRRHGSGQNGDA